MPNELDATLAQEWDYLTRRSVIATVERGNRAFEALPEAAKTPGKSVAA